MRVLCFVAPGAFFAVVAACSSSDPIAPSPDASLPIVDGGPSGDAITDGMSLVDAAADARDASSDAGDADAGACKQTIAQACAFGTSCAPTDWAAAVAACAATAPMHAPGSIEIDLGTCGAYDVRFEINELGQTRYYDHATGALVALVDNANPASIGDPLDPGGPCLAGPSDFARPRPCTVTTRCLGDAGAGDAAGDAQPSDAASD